MDKELGGGGLMAGNESMGDSVDVDRHAFFDFCVVLDSVRDDLTLGLRYLF